jgi:WXXGXW repeat (2 copies)
MRVRNLPILSDTQPLSRGGYLLAAAFLLLASLSPAVAQQYPPSSYPSYPSYPGPGAAPPTAPPAYGDPAAFAPQAPPAPQYEAVPPPPPGPAMVWTPGYWSWAGRWVWVPGRYVARPYAHALWVPGAWRPRHGGWVWVPGHWRR